MENLITKASAAAALKHLLKNSNTSPDEIDYILSCSEEAVGDRYNRGGGSLAKAIGEMAGCENASGPDIKAFCAAPIYAIVLASSLIKAGVYKKVAVVGGGCLAKIGMKFRGHIASSMPILEDVLGAVAFLITKDDKKSPVINLNAVGKCHVKSGTSQQKVMESLVLKPLKKIKKKITDIDKFAVELHNPEITIPSKTGDVPRKNYEMIAALAVRNKEINREEFENFISLHGMPGFSPSQGHIPAGISFVGHAIKTIGEERIQNAMFVARGSLFLGRMSQLYDGASFVIEKNPAQGG
jgi:betaine reductase